jgi:copper(I)-binding protein
MSKALPLAALLIGTLAGCGESSRSPTVSVEHAWVRLAAVKGRPAAGYFTLHANRRPMHLISVSSPQVRRIELHDSSMDGKKMRMEMLTNQPFERDDMRFEPGGKHAMLFDIDRKLKPGDKIALTFTFDPAPPVTVAADVVAAGDEEPGR